MLELSPFASGQVTTSTLNQVTASPLLGQVTASTLSHMTASTPVTNNSTAGQSRLPLNHPILASAPKDINPLNCKKGHSGREFIPSYIVLALLLYLRLYLEPKIILLYDVSFSPLHNPCANSNPIFT